MSTNHCQRAFLTSDAAKYLGVSRHTLEAWRAAGSGPTYRRIGTGPRSRALYTIDDLDAWVDSLDRIEASVGGDAS